ncbi:helix-turn-helix domain-containing protein [Streptomyces sp. bgisy100]|uniref:helix-turn-helix domain-containing protein n=1 Tax=Streptomyces sp. bgisy100 TaxID=3413783 RepID=UPI003D741204
MSPSDNRQPTWRGLRIARELRKLRVQTGRSQEAAAEVLQCGQAKISHIESGYRGIRKLDLNLLLDLYGVEDEAHRASLHRLALDRRQRGWSSTAPQGPLLYGLLEDYLTIEEESERVRAYESVVLPGILQTADYARHIIRYGAPEDEVDSRVEARIKRKERLCHPGSEPLELRTIIETPALHRIPEPVREGQLEHLLEMAERDNVTLQVLPVDAAMPLDQYPPFTLFSTSRPPAFTLAWLEHRTGGTLLEETEDVRSYEQTWVEMATAALAPADSKKYLRKLLEDTKRS